VPVSWPVVAIYGLGPSFAEKYPQAVVLAMRTVAGAGSLWAAYLAVDIVRTWLRIGHKSDDDG
jgi:hypothetical protein